MLIGEATVFEIGIAKHQTSRLTYVKKDCLLLPGQRGILSDEIPLRMPDH